MSALDFLGTLTGYSNFLGTLTGSSNSDVVGYAILDDVYSHNAIILQNAVQIFNIPVLSPLLSLAPGVKLAQLPLIGLVYKTEGEINLLEYEWSEYPYLSKLMITNAGVKQATRFQLMAHSVISPANPVVLNIIKVQYLIQQLDTYAAGGGLFTVQTLYGNITDCVLEKVAGVSDDDGLDGTRLRMFFKKTNISSVNAATQQFSDLMQSLASNAAPVKVIGRK